MIEIVAQAAEKTGGVVALARELGIKHTALYSWKRVPTERVVHFSRITGIPPHELRPDLADIFRPSPQDEAKPGERA